MILRKILLLNGPNLDMLGTREPEVYGRDTLATLEQTVRMYAEQHDAELTCFQSNSEAKLIGKIHDARGKFDGIVYNPGAHTHYSYALRDAVGSIDVPVVEVHLSDIESRETFRRKSVIAPACVAQVKGLGVGGYCRALDVLLENEGLPRLGEGYEGRFDMSGHILVAGRETTSVAKTPASTEVSEAVETASGPTIDIAVDSVDVGALSNARQNMVREACDNLGISSLLVRDTSNIRWITGFDGVFDEERAHALLVSSEQSVLHTDSRYSNALRAAAADAGSNVAIDESRMGHFEFARRQLAPKGIDKFPGKLGIEDTITYAEFVKAAEAFTTANLAPTSDVVLALRSVKDPSELQRLRAAQAITDAAFLHILDFMRPGMTEREVQLELESFMLNNGAESLAFSSIVACGENGADPHAVPGSKRLEAGQCVVMDFGARAYGYCADMTRTVFLGEPKGDMARAWKTLKRANETVEQMLKPGVTGRDAHETAERILAEGGFGGCMGHGLGHGVGLVCHELPILNLRNGAPLVEGNVVTVEPGIYLPGKFGMRLEDCGVITAFGYEPFSKLGHDIVII